MFCHWLKHSKLGNCVLDFSQVGRSIFCRKRRYFLPHSTVAARGLLTPDMAKSVGETHNFPKEEEEILELWKKLDAFKTSLKQSEGKPRLLSLHSNLIFFLMPK